MGRPVWEWVLFGFGIFFLVNSTVATAPDYPGRPLDFVFTGMLAATLLLSAAFMGIRRMFRAAAIQVEEENEKTRKLLASIDARLYHLGEALKQPKE